MPSNGSIPSGSLALDFLNTVGISRGRPIDLLGTADDLLGWLGRAGLLSDRRLAHALASPATARLLLTEAHRLRGEIRRLVDACSLQSTIPDGTIFAVNRMLEASHTTVRLTIVPEGLRLVEHEAGDSVLTILAPLALAASRLVTTAEPSRIRRCAAQQCTNWFVDTSKGGRRRWCSMARCGNRAKAAKHRRKRSSTG